MLQFKTGDPPSRSLEITIVFFRPVGPIELVTYHNSNDFYPLATIEMDSTPFGDYFMNIVILHCYVRFPVSFLIDRWCLGKHQNWGGLSGWWLMVALFRRSALSWGFQREAAARNTSNLHASNKKKQFDYVWIHEGWWNMHDELERYAFVPALSDFR